MTGSAASSGQTTQKTSRFKQMRWAYGAMIGYLKKPYAWVIACIIATVVAIVLGVILGWRFRTRQLQDPGGGLRVRRQEDAGTLRNLLAQSPDMSGGHSSSTPSNGRPDQSVFQFNATALRFDNWSNAPFFRTVVNLYENHKQAAFVLCLRYRYASSILSLEGVTDMNFIIYRTVVYAIVIIMAMWLVNLDLTAIMIKAVCFRYRMEPSVLVVPVSTLFAFTSLRGTMPGAPASFGAIIDFVGTLPTFAFLIMSTLFCLLCFLFGEDYMKNPVKEKP
ncbi:hypothetical protein EWM64_g5230 [Hericium alpestre]|uniref:Uncharacterized protein n=1 Tax=Hericium alpestre TaxID=135208 RepID=A0A4Y9ZXN4_9AGAM|nr:hypothetical protein EWM64_g5230 [Hericium alpestre]